MHQAEDGTVSVRVFWPGAGAVNVLDAKTGKQVATLELIHPGRLLRRADPAAEEAVPLSPPSLGRPPERPWQAEDAYRFPPILGELDIHLLARGHATAASTSGSARTR